MKPLEYSVVIATFQRPGPLRTTLESLAVQTRLPARVVIVDASPDEESALVCTGLAERLPIERIATATRSAAMQRNEGAADVTTPLIAFMDDDIVLGSDTMELLCVPFEDDPEEKIGGVAGRVSGMEHKRPQGMLWWYYRIQAGYPDRHYGARLFGPAINCVACYEDAPELIPAEWLASTCVVYRTGAFAEEKFPVFEGYSFMEDVHLSARVAKKHRLYFHSRAVLEHRSQPSIFKSDLRALARSRVKHQRMVATDVMGQGGVVLELNLLLHRVFASISIVRQRAPQWIEELKGTWS